MKFKLSKSLLLVPLITLAACASYQAAPLSSLTHMIHNQNQPNEKGIVAVAHAFDKNDCKLYLDRDVISKGYQPVQIYIQNNSDQTYTFAADRISLAAVDYNFVADKVHTSTVGRAAGYGVGALFFLPLAVPAVVDGIKSSEANAKLDRDFSAKSMKSITLAPRASINKLIFVPVGDYQPQFTVGLLNQGSSDVVTIQMDAN